jgi:hypothetical protein
MRIINTRRPSYEYFHPSVHFILAHTVYRHTELSSSSNIR